MGGIYTDIIQAKKQSVKLLAILLDPDKIVWTDFKKLLAKINQSPATHVFIGGSLVESSRIDELIIRLKEQITLPIILFPGDPSQISIHADGILFLSLISGKNPDYLITHQIKAAPILKQTNLEIMPTAYMLIAGGNTTAVELVSQTSPIERDNENLVLNTAMAGEMMGNKLVYLEAGSGAQLAVPEQLIKLVANNIHIPLIVGGGITSFEGIDKAHAAGADIVVIGTAFEKDINFFNK